MSAKNGHLVALRTALFHSVPAHVHELRRRVSQLAADNDELMSYAYSKTKALKISIYQQEHNCAQDLIGYAHDKRSAFQFWQHFILAATEDAPQKTNCKERSKLR